MPRARPLLRGFVFFSVLGPAFLTGCACADGEALTIESPAAVPLLELCVRVASTEAERMAGLRGAPALEAGEGLLLDFPIEDEVCIVNDGVAYALDVAYADRDGVITVIERGVPAEDGTALCHGMTQRVLEARAGGLAAADVGDRLR